ncbi:MAG: S-layer homology domain-containing protein [Desulfurispora sp.]|uniref:S-layer homology domain-containing protein n=1 Tax=Desulfurispora sp. TaxID=3014275 RepID=UPI004049E583
MGQLAGFKGVFNRAACSRARGCTGAVWPVFLALLLVLAGLFSPSRAPAAQIGDQQLKSKAVEFIQGRFAAGEDLDGYTAHILLLAGEELGGSKWTAAAKRTAGDASLQNRLVVLAGLLGDRVSPVSYIMGTQNPDGSFGPYANLYGTKAALQALAEARKKNWLPDGESGVLEGAITRAVGYLHSEYQKNSGQYAAAGQFDYRCVQALAVAGEDLKADKWRASAGSLYDQVLSTAEQAYGSSDSLGAGELAKHLLAVVAVEPQHDLVNQLAGAILTKQQTVNGQVYFGDSIYEDVLVLTALGQAGKLSGLDQQAALAYLNRYKHTHQNSWGQAAGVAWGSYEPEEADLTGQVLTALSYFSTAGTAGSEVARDIEAGFIYLKDIQDRDTGAIRVQYDSTFASAEVLLAALANNRPATELTVKSRSKTLAGCLQALNHWPEQNELKERLASLLAGRQIKEGAGAGSFENSVYSDFWVLLALGETGQLGQIDQSAARAYVLSKQAADGSWGETFDQYYPDFLSTAQALRVLKYLPGYQEAAVQQAVQKGLAYLKGLQQADGGVYATPFDDPAVDNAELLLTLKHLGQDAARWKNSAGKTPLDYLRQNSYNAADGTFGAARNTMDATWVLTAVLAWPDSAGSSESGGGGSGGSGGGTVTAAVKVYIAVQGRDGELLFRPGLVEVEAGGRWGLTALGALEATGLSFTHRDGFVTAIAGQANSGMQGWMYSVNGQVPMVLASQKAVQARDKVIWWYSKDMNNPVPTWNELEKQNNTGSSGGVSNAASAAVSPSGLKLPAGEKALQELGSLTGGAASLEQAGQAVRLLAAAIRPAYQDLRRLQKELAGHQAALEKDLKKGENALLKDQAGEAALLVPEGALAAAGRVTLREVSSGLPAEAKSALPSGWRVVSTCYKLELPALTTGKSLQLMLKSAWPAYLKGENLQPALWTAGQKWLTLPAVLDEAGRQVLARVEQGGYLVLLYRSKQVSFLDLQDEQWQWARPAVQELAAWEVVNGVGQDRFAPQRSLSRAELAALLSRMLGLSWENGNAAQFSDVQASDWYAPAVTAVRRAGLMQGDAGGVFAPQRPISRQEFLVVLARAWELAAGEQALSFADAAGVADWAREGVQAAVRAGLVRGDAQGRLNPAAPLTRAECAVILQRALQLEMTP